MDKKNIREIWFEKKAEAKTAWRETIEAQLFPALQELGVRIDSVSSLDPAPGGGIHLMWFGYQAQTYLEITASTEQGFFCKLIKQNAVIFWPNLPEGIYDKQNTTIEHLTTWLKTNL